MFDNTLSTTAWPQPRGSELTGGLAPSMPHFVLNDNLKYLINSAGQKIFGYGSIPTPAVNVSGQVPRNQLAQVQTLYTLLGNHFNCTFASNVYTLTPTLVTNTNGITQALEIPTILQDGMAFRFVASNSNTVASSCSITGLTVSALPIVKPVFTQTGVTYSTLSENDILASQTCVLYYSSTAYNNSPCFVVWVYGTASFLDVGTSANNIIQLDASAKLPAVDGSQLTNLAVNILPNFISGLQITSNTTTPATQIDVASGMATESTGSAYVKLGSAITKSILTSFVAGSGNGGLGNGLTITNATLYYVFLIANSANTLQDIYFDTSASASNIPTGYTYYKRIGSVYYISSASGIKRVKQVKDEVIYTSLTSDYSGTVAGGVAQIVTLPFLPQVNIIVKLAVYGDGGNAVYKIYSSLSTEPSIQNGGVLTNSAVDVSGNTHNVITSNGQIIVKSESTSSINFTICVLGFQNLDI